jgi:type IV pilus assembly protein PilB
MRSAGRGHEALADVIIRRFGFTEESLADARSVAANTHTHLELVLADQGLVSDRQMAIGMGEYLHMPVISLTHFTPDEELLRKVPSQLLANLHALPLDKLDSHFTVAISDPFDVFTQDQLTSYLGRNIQYLIAPQRDIDNILQKHTMKAGGHLEEIIRDVNAAGEDIEITPGEDEPEIEEIVEVDDDAPVVRIVNSILGEALSSGASDIHIEPFADKLVVRYRIDGVLYDQPSPPKYMQWAITSRIKIIARLDIAERRLPQDGRFTIRAPSRNVDVRVSLIPTACGQKVVLRILDKLNLKSDMAALGLVPDDYEKLERAIHRSSGLILITGPTGSGKTTTLYSALQEISSPEVNVITIEDPIEYQLPRINQIQAHPSIGLTFAAGLRAVLRQDPDIVMVGEIRDRETAGIAVQASLTGHLVLSTLHTNDAAGAVARLTHMGVETFLLSSSLIMSQAQRIFRKLCPACKQPRELQWDALQRQGIDCERFAGVTLYHPAGCLHCNNIGFMGRDAIMEILEVDEELQDLILQGSDANHLRRVAVSKGMATLREGGLARAARGETSLEEIIRVTST